MSRLLEQSLVRFVGTNEQSNPSCTSFLLIHPGSWLSACRQPTPASGAAGGGFVGGPEKSGAGRLAPGRTGRATTPGSSHLLGWEDQEGPGSQPGPPAPQASAPVSLRNQKTPVRSREVAIFGTVGETANASLLFKNIWCMSRADRSPTAQSLALGSRPSAAGLPPSAAHRPRAHVGRLLSPHGLCRGPRWARAGQDLSEI